MSSLTMIGVKLITDQRSQLPYILGDYWHYNSDDSKSFSFCAGTPPTIIFSGTSLITTARAATTDLIPMDKPAASSRTTQPPHPVSYGHITAYACSRPNARPLSPT